MPRVVLPNQVLLAEVTRLLAQGESVTLRAKGNSMLPFIVGERDSVVLGKAEALKLGDIALAHLMDGRYVLHRIVSIDGQRVTLMGDGNLYGTEQCNLQQIEAVAVKIVRNGKYIDCVAPAEQRKAKLWRLLKPARRYLLAIYRQIKQKQKK